MPPKNGLPSGVRNAGERPAALARNRADRGLVARIHVRTFVAVHLHRHVKLIDHRRDFGIFVALAVNHVAPVAPDRADIEQNRLAFRARVRKCFLAPFTPIHGLMRRGAQIGARGILQSVCFVQVHVGPFDFDLIIKLAHMTRARGISVCTSERAIRRGSDATKGRDLSRPHSAPLPIA